MEKSLRKEYREFLKKHSQDYGTDYGFDRPVLDDQRAFEGFVCYKSMTEPRDLVIGLVSAHIAPCMWPQINDFFENNGLNLSIFSTPPKIFIRVWSQDLLEKLSDKTFTEELAKQENDFRINDLYYSENIKNPNRNPRVDDYKKIKGLLAIIGDTCKINLIPYNFPQLDLRERITIFEEIFGKRCQLVDYSYTLSLFDSMVSEVIKFYDVLERTSSDFKTKPFFSTRDIFWKKWGKDTIDINEKIGSPIIYEHEPEISADYYQSRNIVETRSIYDHLIVGDADFELVSIDEPLFSIRPREVIPFEIKPSEEVIQRIRELGIKVVVRKR